MPDRLKVALKAGIEHVYDKFEIEFRSVYTDNADTRHRPIGSPAVLRLPAGRHAAADERFEVAEPAEPGP